MKATYTHPIQGAIFLQGHLCLLVTNPVVRLHPAPLVHQQQHPFDLRVLVCVCCVCVFACLCDETENLLSYHPSITGFDRLRSSPSIDHHYHNHPLAEGIYGKRTTLMSADIRTALNCLRHPSRFMPISRTQLSRVHTGDSIQNISENKPKYVVYLDSSKQRAIVPDRP